MSNHGKELYEFGPFRLDSRKRVLLRDSQLVPLQLKAFETLLVLVRNSEQVVLKRDLMKAVWPNTFVEESNLAQNIFVLRKTLGSLEKDHRYIVTIPGRGYKFAGKVRVVAEEESLLVESHSQMGVVIWEESFPQVAPAPVIRHNTILSTRQKVALAVSILALAVVAVALRRAVPAPKVIQFRQLTHLGTLVHNTKLMTDGPRIYFRMWDGKERVVRYVSTEGGEVFPVEKPIANMDIDGISPNGSEFLQVNLTDRRRLSESEDSYPSLWRVPVPSGSPQPVGDVHTRDAGWSPDGHAIAYSFGSDLYLVNPDGTNSRKIASLPGEAFYPVWSPDSKRLRFSVADPRKGTTLWQADLRNNTVKPLLAERPRFERPWAGGWTRDGKYFFYSALGDWTTRNIWAIREGEMLRWLSPEPTQITAGPLTFYLPTPSKDGKSIFVVGEQLRGQLVSYDARARQFVPYAHGISADQVTFSRDGKWMAYVEFPSGVLVRSRVDGSERRQITFPPMQAFNPQWSPDGVRVAFQAKAQMQAQSKIYLIASVGGVPALATAERQEQQFYPSWSSDGGSIVYSGLDEIGAKPALYNLDVKTKQVSPLSGSNGLSWGQISPDGRHVVALEYASRRVILYDTQSHKTQNIAELGEYPRWSTDGQYTYFNTSYWHPRGINGGVYRWKLATNITERVTKYPEFLLAGAYSVCYGITPDGSTLLVRDVSTRDLYALDMELP